MNIYRVEAYPGLVTVEADGFRVDEGDLVFGKFVDDSYGGENIRAFAKGQWISVELIASVSQPKWNPNALDEVPRDKTLPDC